MTIGEEREHFGYDAVRDKYVSTETTDIRWWKLIVIVMGILIVVILNGCQPASESSPLPSVDYDLTSMGADMTYSTVFQILSEPTPYIDKTFRLKGVYQKEVIDGKEISFIVVTDSAGCCSQALEFEFADSSCPEEGTEILIEGEYGIYTDGDTMYLRLNNCKRVE